MPNIRKAVSLAVALMGTSLTGCAINDVGPLVASVRESFEDDISTETRRSLITLQSMAYAQLYLRLPDRKEMAFLLSEHRSGEPDVWIGSGGVMVAMDGARVRWTAGLGSDVEFSVPTQESVLDQYLRHQKDDLRDDAPGVVWMRQRGNPEWIEQVYAIDDLQEVYFRGLAYSGPTLRVTERVRTTGRSEKTERKYWIETKTRSVLRMEAALSPGTEPVVFEWIRVPDPAEPR